MSRLFGTDGVRGIANKDLTVDFAMDLGKAIALVICKDKKLPRVVIGRDTRISGDMIVSGLMAGIMAMGVDVIDLGVIPTPAVSYLVKKYKAIGGIMVSASHNPSEYNGIKIFDKMGYKLPDALEDEIEDVILNIDKYHNNDVIGKIIRDVNPKEDYIDYLVGTCDIKLEGIKILVDCANGSASFVALELFKRLGCEEVVINNNPDGYNINRGCGSTNISKLVSLVVKDNFDCGIAYDGDADRCIMVDNLGNVIDGDYILAITSYYLKKAKKLKKNTVVGTVMSNLGMIKFCEEYGINFERTKVGDRYVLEEMLLKGYNLGGEQSGHVIFREYSNTGDGELTSIQILKIMKKSNKSLNELAKVMKKYPQVLINVEVNSAKKNDFYNNDEINDEIKKISDILGEDGRILVRPSGTESLIRVMIEGEDEVVIEKYAREVADKIREILG